MLQFGNLPICYPDLSKKNSTLACDVCTEKLWRTYCTEDGQAHFCLGASGVETLSMALSHRLDAACDDAWPIVLHRVVTPTDHEGAARGVPSEKRAQCTIPYLMMECLTEMMLSCVCGSKSARGAGCMICNCVNVKRLMYFSLCVDTL